MSVRLGPTSGSYDVQASELEGRSVCSRTSLCYISLLDDAKVSFEIDKRAKGQVLLDRVFEHLELFEKDYFGLQFVDDSPQPEGLRWLDTLKTVRKQIRSPSPYQFYFRVKFYILEPNRLQEEYTRYQLFLQVKRDIADGRLKAPYRTLVLMASFAVQSEFGDFNDVTDGYLSTFRFIPNQPEGFVREVAELHKNHFGQSPADAELKFLETAKSLDLFGVNLHLATDQNNMSISLGVTSSGLVVFHNLIRINTFAWSRIIKISFKRKQFFIQLRRDMMDSVDNLVAFNLATYRSCKNLWKSCVEHHTFFRLQAAPTPSKSLLFNNNFTFTGRTQFESQSKPRVRVERSFVRTSSLRRTVGGSTSVAISSEPGTLPTSNSYPMSLQYQADRLTRSFDSRSLDRKEMRRNDKRLSRVGEEPSASTPSAMVNGAYINSNHTTGAYNRPTSPAGAYNRPTSPAGVYNRPTSPAGVYNRPTSPAGVYSPPGSTASPFNNSTNVVAGLYSPPSSGTVGGFNNSDNTAGVCNPPTGNGGPFNNPNSAGGGSFNTSSLRRRRRQKVKNLDDQVDAPKTNGSALDTHGLVTIRIKPDGHGRFGFNVKGGFDLSQPVLVSRVASGSPADLCIPRLHEGDQVLMINGRDISQHAHDQVVEFIRSSREVHTGELVLLVKPNSYMSVDEAPCRSPGPPSVPRSTSLSSSMKLLGENLQSGAELQMFEQLYRKKPGLTMEAAGYEHNICKNRYRDISPYDQTRVRLAGGEDYINANFVNMEVPGSGIVNRYIAAQGPLPNTAVDFWQMVWQQQCTLIVMLTATVERGRVKCHTYWPPLYESTDMGDLQLTTVKETGNHVSCCRELSLVNIQEGGKQLLVTQLQYFAWPDHGVPDDASDFLQFVVQVRNIRSGGTEPTVVHCSAGIGRTGVLITMETAMCLIEANQPIVVTDIVQQMRDQRAMMIQNSSQYRFVCEAILRVYHESLVSPLPEFKNLHLC